MIKCVTFDLDDTLWETAPVIRQANRELWHWLERNAPAFARRHSLSDLAEGSAMRQQLLAQRPEIAHSMTLIRQALLKQGCQSVGYGEAQAEALAQAAFEVFIRARHRVEPFAPVPAMLAQLRTQGYLIGALSNGNADVSCTPLGALFDFQFNADTVGSAKPHPGMFERALEHTGLQPEQLVHVGDHPINDVQAARQLGIWTVWVSLPGQVWPEPARADAVVRCLSAVPETVEQIALRARSGKG